MSESRYAHALPLGTILDGYQRIDVLGAGGFGITYLAVETGIGRRPANVFVPKNRQPMLIDFGAARLALGDCSTSLTAILSPGYAPFEQYHGRGNQGPWTDINAKGVIVWQEPALGEGPERIWRVLPLEDGGYLLLLSTSAATSTSCA